MHYLQRKLKSLCEKFPFTYKVDETKFKVIIQITININLSYFSMAKRNNFPPNFFFFFWLRNAHRSDSEKCSKLNIKELNDSFSRVIIIVKPLVFGFYELQINVLKFLTTHKMKFSIKDFFSKCDQIPILLRIWSHLLKRALMENFMFCVVTGT